MTRETAQTREALVEVMARAISPSLPRAYSGTNPDVDDQHNGRAQAVGVARSALLALEAAGVRLVPVELTEDMGAEMECQFSTDGQWEAALAASPYKAKEPTND